MHKITYNKYNLKNKIIDYLEYCITTQSITFYYNNKFKILNFDYELKSDFIYKLLKNKIKINSFDVFSNFLFNTSKKSDPFNKFFFNIIINKYFN